MVWTGVAAGAFMVLLTVLWLNFDQLGDLDSWRDLSIYWALPAAAAVAGTYLGAGFGRRRSSQ
jgi:hypothetical protein